MTKATVKGRTSMVAIRRKAILALDDSFAVIRQTIILRLQSAHLRARIEAGESIAEKAVFKLSPLPIGILTPRERAVLELVVQGKTTKRIAVELGIAFKTAASHRYSAMSKLGVGNTAALVRDSVRMGIGQSNGA